MNIQFHATGVPLTEAIEGYAAKKTANLAKVLGDAYETAQARMEFGKEANSHKTGEIFRVELNVDAMGKVFRTKEVAGDLYAAIDESVDEMLRVVAKDRSKKETLLRRGAAMLKRLARRWRS